MTKKPTPVLVRFSVIKLLIAVLLLVGLMQLLFGNPEPRRHDDSDMVGSDSGRTSQELGRYERGKLYSL